MKLLTREAWGAKPPNRSYVGIPWHSRDGTEHHHSVGIYGADGPIQFARRLQGDHLGRDWTDAFYNAGIWYDGTVIVLRPWWAKSGPIEAFTIVYPGNYDNISLTDEQKAASIELRRHTIDQGAKPAILWHRLRANVSCPGNNVVPWLSDGMPIDNEWSTIMLVVYAKVGPDKAAVDWAENYVKPVPGVVTTDREHARAAATFGTDVIAIGGAAADLPNRDNVRKVVGDDRDETLALTVALARSGW